MTVLPLLNDGNCPQAGQCLSAASSVWATCPQAMKCGTCVAWSPRESNRYGRNSGQCMLNRETSTYLDCNAQICPYYKPRDENPAAQQWADRPREAPVKARRRSGHRKLDREVPPPTAAALAHACFADQPAGVAEAGARVLEAELIALGEMPVLLERYRGGSATVSGDGQTRHVSIEAFFARVAHFRGALAQLQEAIEASSLTDEEKAKVRKDLGGIGGSMTTLNILFQSKDQAFKGQGKA